MSRYMLLIHNDEDVWDGLGAQERARGLETYGELWQEMVAAGHGIEGDGLAEAASATLVRVRDGAAIRTDGPFAETKEQLGGYFIVECDLETAIAYAARIPAAVSGTIEVRRIDQDED